MKIFDFNIHLPYIQHDDVNVVIDQDMTLDVAGICKGLEVHQDDIKKANGANFLLFNTQLFQQDTTPFFKKSSSLFERTTFTALIDFRQQRVRTYLEKAKDEGIKAIMFNSYLQRIAESEFNDVLRVCQIAEELDLIICIDGSYGTSKMYAYDNIKLACAVADHITKTPIVIVHAGGLRVLNAMLLALEKQNVWLDTSFSLPYYIKSSVEQDFAFMMNKLGFERIVYGSDHPYNNFEEALQVHLAFFEKHKINTANQEKILFHNALKLFDV